MLFWSVWSNALQVFVADRGNYNFAENVCFTTTEKRKYFIDQLLARAKLKEI